MSAHENGAYVASWVRAMPHLVIGLCLTAVVAVGLVLAGHSLAGVVVSQVGTLASLGIGGLWLDRRSAPKGDSAGGAA